jgi:hypothetical protein
VGGQLSEFITQINNCYPPEVVEFYSPNYSKTLLQKIDEYQPGWDEAISYLIIIKMIMLTMVIILQRGTNRSNLGLRILKVGMQTAYLLECERGREWWWRIFFLNRIRWIFDSFPFLFC